MTDTPDSIDPVQEPKEPTPKAAPTPKAGMYVATVNLPNGLHAGHIIYVHKTELVEGTSLRALVDSGYLVPTT